MTFVIYFVELFIDIIPNVSNNVQNQRSLFIRSPVAVTSEKEPKRGKGNCKRD